MKPENKKETLYSLWVLRRDGEHISVLESKDYDEMYEVYKELTARWSSCIKDQTPFFLERPVVTTFDPGLIYEITIKPIVDTMSSNRYDNPYVQAMNSKGLGAMLSDLQDSGYR